MTLDLDSILKSLTEAAKDREDTRPDCPAVDGEIPHDVIVSRIRKGRDRAEVDLLPNCKGPCIRAANGLHFEVSKGVKGNQGCAKLCPCGRANKKLASIQAMKLPVEAVEKNHMVYNWEIEGRELQEKTLYFLECLKRGEQKVLILVGDPGTGKTHLLHTIAYMSALIAKESRRVNYISQPHYLAQVKAGFDDPHKRVQRVIGSRALLLDEVGYGRQTDWERAEINQLLHHAWQSGQSLVLATDIGWERLGRFLDQRIKDRLIEGTEGKRLVHRFVGESQRSKGVQW